jgi:hypothetical protein
MTNLIGHLSSLTHRVRVVNVNSVPQNEVSYGGYELAAMGNPVLLVGSAIPGLLAREILGDKHRRVQHGASASAG